MKKIGITGGIGSGKSAVTDFLRGKGYAVIDADEISREAAMPGEPAMLRLEEEIGDDIFHEDGTLNRQELAKIMFSNPLALMAVNGIFHQDIFDRMEVYLREREACGDRVVFVSVPLLFEADAGWMVEESWLVTADDEVRLQRVGKRDGLSPEDVRARMDNQMPEEEKRKRADIVIENNGTIGELHARVEALLQAESQ